MFVDRTGSFFNLRYTEYRLWWWGKVGAVGRRDEQFKIQIV